MNKQQLILAITVALGAAALWMATRSVIVGDFSAHGIINTLAAVSLGIACAGHALRNPWATRQLLASALAVFMSIAFFDVVIFAISRSDTLVVNGSYVLFYNLVHVAMIVGLVLAWQWEPLREHVGSASMYQQRRALLSALKSDDAESLRAMVENGFDVDSPVPGKLGQPMTPLGLSVMHKAPRCAQVLVMAGADRQALCSKALLWAVPPSRLAERRGLSELFGDTLRIQAA
ncbi:MAG: hypothetical protein H6832_17430 [Planctomycetes bacterium]|nr:hypothetical protein [Planctomycetota bacterium]